MKKTLILLCALFSIGAFAQIEVSPMVGYFFGGGIYCGIGIGESNCGASVNGTVVVFEGDLTQD